MRRAPTSGRRKRAAEPFGLSPDAPPEDKGGKKHRKGKGREGRKVPLGVVVLLLAAAVLFTFQMTFLTTREQYEREISELQLQSADLLKLETVRELFDENYIGEIDKSAAGEGAVAGYVGAAGDRYAEYYTKDEFTSLEASQNGESFGIGIIVTREEDALRVQWVCEGSPASKAGVSRGDRILAVDGVGLETYSYEEMVAAVGGEEGTTVELTLSHSDASSGELPQTLLVTRGGYTASSVTYCLLPDGVTGYINLLSFENTTPGQTKAAVAALQEAGAERFVFDLRDNGGGLLDAVVETLDFLLPEGVIVTTRTAGGEKKEYRSEESELDAPMAVLVNGGTASAAELFTAALRDYHKAVIVGETTFGKGVAQSTYTLGDGSAVKLTTHYYDPPSGVNYDGVGITPDLLVGEPEGFHMPGLFATEQGAEDPQLAAALAAFSSPEE